MPSAKLTTKGQITIPKPIRDHLSCTAGDRLDFRVEDDGTVRIERRGHDFRRLRGLLHREDQPPVSVEEMDAAIRRRAARDFGETGG